MQRHVTKLFLVGALLVSFTQYSSAQLFRRNKCSYGSCSYSSSSYKSCGSCTNKACADCKTYAQKGQVAGVQYAPGGYDETTTPPVLATPTQSRSDFTSSRTLPVAKEGFTVLQTNALSWANHLRKTKGLPPLQLSRELCDKAESHCNWMIRDKLVTYSTRIPVGMHTPAKGQRGIKPLMRGIDLTSGEREKLHNGTIQEFGFSWIQHPETKEFYYTVVYGHKRI